MVTVEMTERQARYLVDILDFWIEGYDGTVEQVQGVDQAQMFAQPEDLLRMVDELNWQRTDAIDLKVKLLEARRM
jgi:hypothetical protein